MSGRQIVIAGGGAAGLAAAVTAARLGAQVTLLERADRVGKKILQTGNGRCNLSNTAVAPRAYNAPDFVKPALSHIGCEALRNFFASLGLLTYADAEGRIYPVSDAASSVLDVLRLSCEEYGVRILCGFEAARLLPNGTVCAADGRTVHGDAVIVTTGGGTALLQSVGHRLTPFSPVLCPLATDTAPIRGLSGLRAKCAVTLRRGGQALVTQRGELLFRDYGVSGIVIFDLSRHAQPGDLLSLDFLPDIPLGKLEELLAERTAAHPARLGEALLTGMFHSRVNAALCRAAGGRVERLARTLKGLCLEVKGCGDRKQAQVTRGGAALSEFDSATLRSVRIPNLYAAGETLDIDGACGGYNLHWAFASGILAAHGASGGRI